VTNRGITVACERTHSGNRIVGILGRIEEKSSLKRCSFAMPPSRWRWLFTGDDDGGIADCPGVAGRQIDDRAFHNRRIVRGPGDPKTRSRNSMAGMSGRRLRYSRGRRRVAEQDGPPEPTSARPSRSCGIIWGELRRIVLPLCPARCAPLRRTNADPAHRICATHSMRVFLAPRSTGDLSSSQPIQKACSKTLLANHPERGPDRRRPEGMNRPSRTIERLAFQFLFDSWTPLKVKWRQARRTDRERTQPAVGRPRSAGACHHRWSSHQTTLSLPETVCVMWDRAIVRIRPHRSPSASIGGPGRSRFATTECFGSSARSCPDTAECDSCSTIHGAPSLPCARARRPVPNVYGPSRRSVLPI